MSFFDHIIHGIEVAGNKLPNPFVLFVMVWIFMIVLSQILAGVSAIDPASGETVRPVPDLGRCQCNRSGIRRDGSC